MPKIYIIMKADGEYEDYYTSPIEAWDNKEDAEKAVQEYNAPKEVFSLEEWETLCEEVEEKYEDLNYIEGILKLHKDISKEKLINTEIQYSVYGKPQYYLLAIDFHNKTIK